MPSLFLANKKRLGSTWKVLLDQWGALFAWTCHWKHTITSVMQHGRWFSDASSHSAHYMWCVSNVYIKVVVQLVNDCTTRRTTMRTVAFGDSFHVDLNRGKQFYFENRTTHCVIVITIEEPQRHYPIMSVQNHILGLRQTSVTQGLNRTKQQTHKVINTFLISKAKRWMYALCEHKSDYILRQVVAGVLGVALRKHPASVSLVCCLRV